MCLRQQTAAPSLELKLAVISVQNGTFVYDDKSQIVADSSTLDSRDTSKRNNAHSLLKACRKVKKLRPDLHVTQCALKASHVTIHGHHGLQLTCLTVQHLLEVAAPIGAVATCTAS